MSPHVVGLVFSGILGGVCLHKLYTDEGHRGTYGFWLGVNLEIFVKHLFALA